MKPLLLRKDAYGVNPIDDPLKEQEMTLEETADPQPRRDKGVNRVNTTPDTHAEADFPGLGEHKHRFPARGIEQPERE